MISMAVATLDAVEDMITITVCSLMVRSGCEYSSNSSGLTLY